MWLGALDGSGPIYRQLYRAIRGAILDGRLRPGERLPSTRWLADDAGVARNRVILAYTQLIDEGYLVGRVGSGTCVAREVPGDGAPNAIRAPRVQVRRPAARRSRFANRVAKGVLDWRFDDIPQFDFHYGRPSFRDFPHSIWRRMIARQARRAQLSDLDYAPGASAGLPFLRSAIAGHLLRWRGVRVSAEQIIVTNGSQQALGLAARLLLDPGDPAAIENPHYLGARLALQGAGAEIVPIPVDTQGLDVAALEREPRRPRLIYVTPSHQFPMGAVLPLSRRLALLRFAQRVGAYVIEDDYDGEYRYTGMPLESLQDLDEAARVLYVGTFSKILFPALRIGYIVAPTPLAAAFVQAKTAADFGNAQFEQRVLADFINDGHLDVHVRRSRRRHAARRRVMLETLSETIGKRATVLGCGAGLHVVVILRGVRPTDVARIVALARERSIGVYTTQPYYLGRRPRNAELLLGHGALSEDEIREGVRRLAEVIRVVTR